MKITKSQLKRIIKEELEAVLAEQGFDPAEEKCKKQGGTYRVKPGTDQMECVLPRGLEEDLAPGPPTPEEKKKEKEEALARAAERCKRKGGTFKKEGKKETWRCVMPKPKLYEEN